MPCLQPYEDAGTPHRHRCHLLPHIRLYTLPSLAALAINHQFAVLAFLYGESVWRQKLGRSFNMTFDEFNDKITPAVCTSNSPTSVFPTTLWHLQTHEVALKLVLPRQVKTSNIQSLTNHTPRTPAGKHHQTAAPPSINPSPYPSPANHSDNGSKNKTSTAMPKSSSQNWYTCGTNTLI